MAVKLKNKDGATILRKEAILTIIGDEYSKHGVKLIHKILTTKYKDKINSNNVHAFIAKYMQEGLVVYKEKTLCLCCSKEYRAYYLTNEGWKFLTKKRKERLLNPLFKTIEERKDHDRRLLQRRTRS